MIIVEKIAVVRRQRIRIEHVPHTGRLHRRTEIRGANLIRVFNGIQSPGGSQGGNLVIGEGKHVGPILQISKQHVLAVGLALGLIGNLEAGLSGVMILERGKNLLEKRLVLLGAPNSQRNRFHLVFRPAAHRIRMFPATGRQKKKHPYGHKQEKIVLFHSVRPFLLIPPNCILLE